MLWLRDHKRKQGKVEDDSVGMESGSSEETADEVAWYDPWEEVVWCDQQCPICFEMKGAGLDYVSPGTCAHEVCVQCLEQYFTFQVRNREVPIKCVKNGCPAVFSPEVVSSLVSPELYAKFEDYLVVAALQTDPNVCFCPTPDCGFAVIGHVEQPVIECGSCNRKFCFDCSCHWEPGHTCKVTMLEGSEVKRCPRCRAYIEKVQDRSCNHMICSNCSCDFCWLCGEEISEIEHFWTPSGCTYYGKRPWGRSKKFVVTATVLVSGPVLIALGVVVIVPYVAIGLPVVAAERRKKDGGSNLQVAGAGIKMALFSPIAAAVSAAFVVPVGLCAIYGYVPYAIVKGRKKTKVTKTCR